MWILSSALISNNITLGTAKFDLCNKIHLEITEKDKSLRASIQMNVSSGNNQGIVRVRCYDGRIAVNAFR